MVTELTKSTESDGLPCAKASGFIKIKEITKKIQNKRKVLKITGLKFTKYRI